MILRGSAFRLSCLMKILSASWPVLGVVTWAFSVSAAEPLRIKLGGQPGPYTVAQWKQDWPGCAYEDGVAEGRFELAARDAQTWLRARYPAGAVGPGEGGGGWRLPFPRRGTAELRYTVLFEEGFDFNKGGKLPGLCGGPKTITGGDTVNGLDGFSARLMWRREGRAQAYVYHMDQPAKYGDEFNFPESFRFPIGMPVRVRLEVRLNTPDQKNGELRIWTRLPGEAEQLQVEQSGLRFRRTDSYGIDGLLFNTFHGGNDSSWAPARAVTALFGAFEVR